TPRRWSRSCSGSSCDSRPEGQGEESSKEGVEAMTPVVVKPVSSWWEKRQFLHLPWRLYRQDTNWVPPLRHNQKELVGYARHPFYQDAEAQTFLALRQGQACGRIAAILNHAHDRRHREQRGFFGFFESIDDAEVSGKLFEAVRAWFAQRGIFALRG